jgi:UDP-glucuronate 4-epimerase
MKTYLVTGGAGFIGSHVIDHLLKHGHTVINFDDFNDYYDINIKEDNIKSHLNSRNYHLVRGDICHLDELEKVFNKHKIDTIVHLAARAGVRPSIENPLLYEKVNIGGTQNIFELAKKYKINSLVMASSSSVYGNNEKIPFAEEDRVDHSISPYAATKVANEIMGHVYHKLYGINMIFLRFFTVYGPRQRPDLAIYKFVKLIKEDKPIPFFGDGKTARDYTFIDDIVDGVLNAIEYVENKEKVYEIINLGGSHPITLNEMVNAIEQTLNIKAKINNLSKQPGDVERTYADINKAARLLSYNPQTPFLKGLDIFIRWFDAQHL